MINLILFSPLLKKGYYGNRFWRESAKIDTPTFILSTGVGLFYKGRADRNMDACLNAADDSSASVKIWWTLVE